MVTFCLLMLSTLGSDDGNKLHFYLVYLGSNDGNSFPVYLVMTWF